MAQVIKEIQLEVSKPNFIQAIVAKQYDNKSRYLRVQLVDNGEKITVKDTSSVVINARRSDGGENKFRGTVDAGQGTVLVPLTYWMLELEGRVISDVSVYDADKILTTTNFTIEVERASCQNGSVSVDDADVDVLTGLIIEVQNVKANYDVEHTYFANSTNAISSKGVTDALKKRTAAYFNIKDFIIGSIDRTTGKILSTPKTHLISKELFARSASRGGFSVVTNGDVECDVALYDTDGTLVSYVENVTQGDSEEHEFVPAYQHRYLFTINGATDINNQTDIQHIYDNAKLFAMPTVMFDNLIVDTEVKEGSENPVSGGAVKVYVDEAMDNLDISSDSLNLEDSTNEKISFAVVNGKLVANIKSASDEPQKPTDALDVVAYEGKTYRDIFITNNLFPCGDFENGINGVTIKGTPEVVSDVYNGGSNSLKCFASSSAAPLLTSTHYYTESGTLYAACCCRVDRRVAGVLGVKINISAAATYNKDVRWTAKTDGFEKGSCLTTFPASTVRFSVGSFVGSTADIDGYIDDVVLVDLSMFSTMPDQSTMDALYDEYINILTGKTPDVPVVDENSFVISNEENIEIQVADVVEEGNTNPVSSGAVYEALQSVDVVTDNEMSNTSENPVQNKVAKAYVDSKEDLTLKDSTDEKISFSIENGKLIATIKQDTEDTGDIEDTEDALDVVAYEGKTYRDIFVTNNLFPCGDFENGIEGVTVKGTPEVVSDVSNAGSNSLKCFASSSTSPYLKSTHYYTEGATLYAACCCRVDRRVAGILGIRITPSGGTQTAATFSAPTNGFEKLSTINTFPASTVGFFVGSFIGTTVDIDGYIDDVVLVDLSMFSTMPDQSTMDALYDEYINILTGKNSDDDPSGDSNDGRYVISNEDNESITIAGTVEEGNTNPVSSDAVFNALQDIKSSVEDSGSSFDYTQYGMPILYFTGDTTGISKDNAVTLNYVYGDKTGTCTLKWQGSSSLNYPKKNYTVKFDNKFEAKDGWGEQKKYCLKANYIDFSHARNVVSAKLWGQVVKSRLDDTDRRYSLPNAGAIDGFPVLVVINNEYQGLYTFNIPKDGWMFGISDENSLVVTVDGYSKATGFYALETDIGVADNGSFEIEYKPDNVTDDEVQEKLNAFISAVLNSTEENFETTVGEHCDLDSFIDYVCFHSLITGLDGESKNYILTSYDMGKWFITSYDMDSTYGLYWNGKSYVSIKNKPTFVNFGNNLIQKIVKCMPDRVKERYDKLRAGSMSENNVQLEFYNFTAGIPKAIKDEECKLWPLIPNTDTNNINQIVNQYILRCKYIDEQAAKL